MTKSQGGAALTPNRRLDVLRGLTEMGRVLVVALWTTARFVAEERGRISPARQAAFAVALARALGPLYIKLAQILAAQSGVLSESFRRGLQDVFDHNEAVPFTTIRRVLEASYGRPVEAIFAYIDAEPIGVGSVAQIHSARLANGQQVAVKIIKPTARRSLQHAMNAAEIMVRIASRFVDRLRPLQLAENFADIRDALLQQTNLTAERERQKQIARLLDSNPTIIVPGVYDALCTEVVLVMDFIEGTPIYRIDEFQGDRPELARRMQNAFFSMIYSWGKFHVDPHPGNILLLSDGRLALLDFGMTAELSDANRQLLRTFNSASVMRLWTQAANYFLKAMVVDAEAASADLEFRRRVAEVIRIHFDERRNRWSTTAFLSDMAPVLRSRDLRMRVDMALLALSLTTAEGVLHLVDPNVDLWGNARRFVEQDT